MKEKEKNQQQQSEKEIGKFTNTVSRLTFKFTTETKQTHKK